MTTKVAATELSAFLPDGKNYLDEQNMSITSSGMSSKDPIRVKANTSYTLTLPGLFFISDDIFIRIEGETVYANDDINDLSNSVVEEQDVHVTFQTSASEEFLSLTIYSTDLIYFYNSYGFDIFQLEEGSNSTSYEEYVAPWVDTSNPTFYGSGAYIGSYQDQKPLEDIIEEHIEVIDEIDGNLTSDITIISNQYTGNESRVGEYDVLLQACDESNNCTSFQLTIIIKDEVNPVITGPNSVNVDIETPYNNIEDLIHTFFLYNDEYDASCDLQVMTNNYTPNNQSIGTYLVTFRITDDSQNTTSKTFTVKVLDMGSPVIEGALIYSSPLSNPLSVNGIVDNLVITDNFNTREELDIKITNDTFTANNSQVGSYSFHVAVTDLSDNVSSAIIVVHVLDDIAPNLSGPDNYSYSYQENYTPDDFLDMMEASDNVTEGLNSKIYIVSNTLSSRTSQVGNFELTFGVKDDALNESLHTIHISIFDDVAPVIYIDNYIVTVNLSSTFEREDALELLITSNELALGNYTTMSLIDEYAGHERIPGSYLQKYRFTNELGEEFEKEFIVQVVGEEETLWNKTLLIRNVAIYSFILGISIFVIVKRKK